MEKTLVKTAPRQVGLSLYLDVLNFSWFSFVSPKQASLDPTNVFLCCQASCYEWPSRLIISDMLLSATVAALRSLMSHRSGSTYVFELVKTSLWNMHDHCYSNWKNQVQGWDQLKIKYYSMLWRQELVIHCWSHRESMKWLMEKGDIGWKIEYWERLLFYEGVLGLL